MYNHFDLFGKMKALRPEMDTNRNSKIHLKNSLSFCEPFGQRLASQLEKKDINIIVWQNFDMGIKN